MTPLETVHKLRKEESYLECVGSDDKGRCGFAWDFDLGKNVPCIHNGSCSERNTGRSVIDKFWKKRTESCSIKQAEELIVDGSLGVDENGRVFLLQ